MATAVPITVNSWGGLKISEEKLISFTKCEIHVVKAVNEVMSKVKPRIHTKSKPSPQQFHRIKDVDV